MNGIRRRHHFGEPTRASAPLGEPTGASAALIHSAAFWPKEKKIDDHGRVSILKQLHADLDAAVFGVYGWAATLADEELLEKLVALNQARAAEEEQGTIRYLRRAFENPNT